MAVGRTGDCQSQALTPDNQKPMPSLLIIAVFGVLLAILRIARAIWALERMIMLITASRQEERRGES